MSIAVESRLARKRLTRGWRNISSAYLARPWSRDARRRVAIFCDINHISYAQLYPFLYYHADLRDLYDVEIRCFPFSELIKGNMRNAVKADIILLQPWFTIDPLVLRESSEKILSMGSNTEISFIDSFAHNDLRLAPYLPDTLRYYLKKSLYVDPTNYMMAFRGDTIHNQYYADLYGLEAKPRSFDTPQSVLQKLRLSPNFFTSPKFIHEFETLARPTQHGRTLDVLTRLGTHGAAVYQHTRQENLKVLENIKGITVSEKNRISHAEYMQEMRRSKLCFSPFGYGELCWRDVEAMLAGSVLIKPNMDHLQTLPNLYDDGKTYLSVKWDLSDLEDVIYKALNDEELRISITTEAHKRVTRYVRNRQFVTDMGFLFA